MPAPAFEDGTFVVEGGGVTEPRAAGCDARGRFILSMALQVDQGSAMEVTRQIYPVTSSGNGIRLGDPEVQSETVPVDQFVTEFPEFGNLHFEPCS